MLECMCRLSSLTNRITRSLKVALGVLTFVVSISHLRGQPVSYEGYGYATRGGQGGDIYHVTTLADGGPGSLRDGIFNRTGPRIIVFDVGGTITMTNTFKLNSPYLTINGETAPAPGITITKTDDTNQFFISGTHDIIIRHLRFRGLYPNGAAAGESDTGIMGIDGDWDPDYYAHDIVLDHLTLLNSPDSAMDIWGEVSDVTVSWCLIANNFHPSTVSYIPDPGQPYERRRRISMHHNVWAHNDERSPQLRAGVADFDYVNNIVYDWDNYGVRIRNELGEPKVDANIINNYFRTGEGDPAGGLIFGEHPGPDLTEFGPLIPAPQGTVITNSTMGNLWVAGNIFPVGNLDQYSTIASPNPVPTNAQVTTYPANQLMDRVIPDVGMKYRTAEEQAMLSEIVSALNRPTDFRVSSITPAGCVLELKAPVGFQNELQYSDSLTSATWQPLTNFPGTGNLVTITNGLTGVSARFYRVITTGLH
jgi:pectate lyase